MIGQQKRARILIQSQQKQGVGKKEKGSYFPIHYPEMPINKGVQDIWQRLGNKSR